MRFCSKNIRMLSLVFLVCSYATSGSAATDWKPVDCKDGEKIFEELLSGRGFCNVSTIEIIFNSGLDFGKKILEWDEENLKSFKNMLIDCRNKDFFSYYNDYDSKYFSDTVDQCFKGITEELPAATAKIKLDEYNLILQTLEKNIDEAKIKELEESIKAINIDDNDFYSFNYEKLKLQERVRVLLSSIQEKKQLDEYNLILQTLEKNPDEAKIKELDESIKAMNIDYNNSPHRSNYKKLQEDVSVLLSSIQTKKQVELSAALAREQEKQELKRKKEAEVEAKQARDQEKKQSQKKKEAAAKLLAQVQKAQKDDPVNFKKCETLKLQAVDMFKEIEKIQEKAAFTASTQMIAELNHQVEGILYKMDKINVKGLELNCKRFRP